MSPFSKGKARKILGEQSPTLRGKAISKKQRGLLGAIAGGTFRGTDRDNQLSALKRKNNGKT